jgi:hypothetical protein
MQLSFKRVSALHPKLLGLKGQLLCQICAAYTQSILIEVYQIAYKIPKDVAESLPPQCHVKVRKMAIGQTQPAIHMPFDLVFPMAIT